MSLSQQVLKEAGKLNLIDTSGSNLEIENLTAARTLTVKDSGKIFTLALAAGFAVTLPTVAAAGNGWYCEFIVRTAPTGAAYTVSSAANDIIGAIHSASGANQGSTTAGLDVITFDVNVALPGDRVKLLCNGTNFYFEGYCCTTLAITIT